MEKTDLVETTGREETRKTNRKAKIEKRMTTETSKRVVVRFLEKNKETWNNVKRPVNLVNRGRNLCTCEAVSYTHLL